MSKQDNKHITTFRQEKLMPEETLEADIKGWLDKKTGQGGMIQHNGQFVLTNKRAAVFGLTRAMSGWKQTIFICSMGFLIAWTALSLYGLAEALVGFSDTYASLVASHPTLATDVGRQTALQDIILQNVIRWSVVAAPLGLVAMLAKW
jgi:hypothetical protein